MELEKTLAMNSYYKKEVPRAVRPRRQRDLSKNREKEKLDTLAFHAFIELALLWLRSPLSSHSIPRLFRDVLIPFLIISIHIFS